MRRTSFFVFLFSVFVLASTPGYPAHGDSPLHTAVWEKNESVVTMLLAAKADPNIVDRRQRTPLLIAVSRKQEAMALQLLAAGADPNRADEKGHTPLRFATGMPSLLKALIEAKADVNAVDSEDRETALYLVAGSANTEAAQMLLDAKADPNLGDKFGATPLHQAAEYGSAAMVRLLLGSKADCNARDRNENTPLLLALGRREPDLDVVKALLEATPDLGVVGKYRGTALHQAAKSRDLEAVKLLLAAKADPNATDNSGKSVLDVASDPSIIAVLEAAGGKSVKADETPLYDPLGRPMNKAAEMAVANRGKPGGNPSEKSLNIMLNSSEEAKALNETFAEERKGNRTKYLTRAVIMGVKPAGLVERINAGAGVNVEDPVFGYALVQAFTQRRGPEVVRCLLDNGADPNKGKPLLLAIRRGGDALAMLLAAGADPMTGDYENTPVLIRAVDAGNMDAVAALLKAGAKPEATSTEGRTALYHALWRSKSPEIVRLLLENGASPASFPALSVPAWRKENIPLALLLLEHGAAASVKEGEREDNTLVTWAVRDDSLELLEAAVRAKVPVTGFDRRGMTQLQHAVLRGNAAMVSALLKAGAPVNRSGIRPGWKFEGRRGKVYVAEDDLLVQAVRKGNEGVVAVLVAAGVNLNARENDSDRTTALHKSVEEGLPGITAILLDAGAKPDIADSYKRTPLHDAVRKNDPQFLALLLAKKANPNLQNENGETPLYEAARTDKAAAVAALLKAGANPNLATAKGRITPLHVAGDSATAAMLLAAKADPNARASEGGTPLHAAAYRNDAETVRLLLAAKADPNARDEEGKTPLDAAKGEDVVKLLKDAGAIQTQ